METIVTVLLVGGGLGLIAAAIAHGYLGQTRLIASATFQSRQAKEIVLAIWHFSSASWAACGAIIAASPWLFDDASRKTAVMFACLPVVYGVVGNAWITRGRHFGWKVFAAAITLAMLGVWIPT